MPVDNRLRKLPFGANPLGLNGACPPELLHMYGLGMEKKAFSYGMELVVRGGVITSNVRGSVKQAIDSRFVAFNCRHADVDMPHDRFRAGVYELSFLTSKEYRALLYQVLLQIRYVVLLSSCLYYYFLRGPSLLWFLEKSRSLLLLIYTPVL